MGPNLHEGERYAHNGVLLRCDKGVVPGLLTVLPRPAHVNGQYQATTADCLPLVNIPPFGVCAITRTPCLPPMLLWTGAHMGAKKVGGLPPLLASSVCQCGLGGRISITMPPPPGALGPPAPTPFDRQTPDQQDATLHQASGALKTLSGGLALVGLAAAVGGLFFPPLEIVAAVALTAAEVTLVAGVAIDVAVAVVHPTADNWLLVGGDALAIGGGYVVGKVIVGPAFNALAKGARSMMAREAAAETATALPKTTQAVDEALAAEAAAAEAAAAQKLTEQEAALLRKLEQKQQASRRGPREANSYEKAKIKRLRKEHKIDKKQNIAYTEGTVDGKAYEQVAHSGHVKNRPNTTAQTPIKDQQLKTHPTALDREIAVRQGKSVDLTRRAHDSEVKILEDLLRKTTSSSKGNIRLVSERPVCESCSQAIEQFRILRPKIRIRVSHAVIK